jgi:hypothetical protein
MPKSVRGGGEVLTCDGRCDKAWGINGRPKLFFQEEEGRPRRLEAGEEPRDWDDYVYVRDSELGKAPGPGETVGLSEGGHMKPSDEPLEARDGERMNKWCARECERSGWDGPRDLERPQPNYRRRPPQ